MPNDLQIKYNNKFDKKRYILKVFGIVQGVGYRPYVYNLAKELRIKGWVGNQGSSLIIDFEGTTQDIKIFVHSIIKKPPKLARIEQIKIEKKEFVGYTDFDIRMSSNETNDLKFISSDIATCNECLRDVFNPISSRYQYAFTNCTNCGPRYSIIKKLPYDRINTTMNSFNMCTNCNKEYVDANNRRFHAQPNCCSLCGPSYKLLSSKGDNIASTNPIKDTISLLLEGKIVAVNGLGGFHLVCNAQNKATIDKLRKRKKRPYKPFAIMAKNIGLASKIANISRDEREILINNKRPIVILDKKDYSILPDNIAPNIQKIGIMLPYTPLHYLLFQKGISFLIMTSGNISGGPIQYENEKAIENLGNIVDVFLTHNREINIPVEDSVVRLINSQENVIRTGRGYTPYTVYLQVKNNILAYGAEEKNTFSISKNGYGYMSQYLGDLKDFDAYITYEKAIENLTNLLEFTPKILVYGLEFNTLTRKYLNKELIKLKVQHHHAHMASCMVEHNIYDPFIWVIFDGTGLGIDGNIWGGEFLVGTRSSFTRIGHLKYITIQGGEKAIKEPWRIAVSYIYSLKYDVKKFLKDINEDDKKSIIEALEARINCFKSSSIGRLFDCVASLLNIRHINTYNGQAAIELENELDSYIEDSYSYNIITEDDMYQIEYNEFLHQILNDINNYISSSVISAKFHNTIVNATVEMVCLISKRQGIEKVVLSGGVFQNEYLLKHLTQQLKNRQIDVYYNQQIPINDSGISIGQLAIADALCEER